MKVDKDFWNIACRKCGKKFDGRSKIAIAFHAAYESYKHLCPSCTRLFKKWLKEK